MNTKGFLVVLVLTLFAVSSGWAAVPAPPVWPQSFSLSPGEKVEFTVPITQAGDIAVNVQWQGSPVVIAIKDPTRTPVAPSTTPQPKNSPTAKVVYSVSATDLQKGQGWAVVVSAPGKQVAGARPAATGQITIQSPAASMQQLADMDAGAFKQLRTTIKTLAPKTATVLSPSSQTMIRTDRTAVTLSQTTRETALRAQMATDLTAFSAKMTKLVADTPPTTASTATIVATQPVGITSPTSLTAPLTRATSPGDPVLSDVTPNQAMPGEHVWITGKNIPTDKFQNAVVHNRSRDQEGSQDHQRNAVWRRDQVRGAIVRGRDGHAEL